jgi:predicted NUDIX family NTP pyrophosphohydrolase
MKQAAGILLYRHAADGIEVLLVHPSGDYNRGKPWSIPKGLPDEGESLEETARRETREEAGVDVDCPLVLLGDIVYKKNGKRVYCFTALAPIDIVPHCASWEVDCAEFVPIDRARTLLHPDQQLFLDWLNAHVDAGV